MGISRSSRFRRGDQFVPELNTSCQARVGSFSHLRTSGFEYVLGIGFWYEMTVAGVHVRWHTSVHVAAQPKLLISSFLLGVASIYCVLVHDYFQGVPKCSFVTQKNIALRIDHRYTIIETATGLLGRLTRTFSFEKWRGGVVRLQRPS
jgi:hypothetical protein